ncbi:MAG: adenosylcobinamide-GDP ribazoletransferase [Chloroflexota bacterium]
MLANLIEPLIDAFAFLTILPVGRISSGHPGRSFAFYPIVGLVIGVSVALAASIRFLPPDLTAFVALLIWVVLTGGLHLDGFADSCDGLLATVAPERRLEIMKDPRTGSWAVVGLVLLLLGKWIALRSVPPLLLILPPIMGRWAMVLAVARFPRARSAGLAVYHRDGFGRTQLIAATIITVLAAILFGWRGVLLLVLTLLFVVIVGGWMAKRLGGGLTGDSYGALCELVEMLSLILLSVV